LLLFFHASYKRLISGLLAWPLLRCRFPPVGASVVVRIAAGIVFAIFPMSLLTVVSSYDSIMATTAVGLPAALPPALDFYKNHEKTNFPEKNKKKKRCVEYDRLRRILMRLTQFLATQRISISERIYFR
jgi:hypothetical protein